MGKGAKENLLQRKVGYDRIKTQSLGFDFFPVGLYNNLQRRASLSNESFF